MQSQEKIEHVLRSIINIFREDIYFSGNYSSYILQLLFLKLWLGLDNESNLKNHIFSENFSLYKGVNWTQIEDTVSDIEVPNLVRYSQLFADGISRFKNASYSAKSHYIGEAITNIFSSIEKINPKLQGVFINPSANQWERFSDHILIRVIEGISILGFDENSLPQSKLLGEAYESVISVLIDSGLYESKSNANCFTPRDITNLIVNLIKPEAEIQVYDPACGSGGILAEAARYFMKQGRDPQKITLYGKEENYELRSIASMNLLLHGISHAEVSLGSIIKNFPVKEERKIQKFDVVITNPPFGVKNWEHYESKNNVVHHFQYGEPPKSSADYVFIQRVLAILTDSGRAAMVVPHGVLFRGGIEGKIRENIVKDDLIEAVISLPQNLFYTTKIASAIIIFNKQKSENRKKKILFIDASYEYDSTRKRNFLTDKIISRIVSTYSDFREETGYSKIASHEEIYKYDYTLPVSRYVEPKKVETELEIGSQVKRVQELEAKRGEIEAQMDACLKTLDIKI